jgi:hypothetical protein
MRYEDYDIVKEELPRKPLTGVILKEGSQWYETKHYVLKSEPDKETYAIINKETNHCEARSDIMAQALYLLRSLEKHLNEFYTEDAAQVPKPAVLTMLRDFTPK